ncbi:MAG TPA: hypothetical protein DE045_13085 [Oceanospirillaceae bacterium]|nr:hypothetical protein [Oceanospirillaceae bacterium]
MNPTYYCALDHFGSLSLTGQDATAFLQGQVTCDLALVSTSQGQAGAYCTPKGNVIANFDLVQHQQSLLLHMPVSMVETVQKAMAKYIVFSKAELTNASEQWCRFAIWGPEAALCIAQLTDSPTSQRSISTFDDGFVWAADSDGNTFIVYCLVDAAQRVTDTLAEAAKAGAVQDFEATQINLGIAYVTPEISDSYVPQMLNLQATGAIDFKKGCYTGQEIVARMQYLGKLKRHLFIGEVATGQALEVGQQIDASKRKNVGKVVSTASLGNNRYAFTAVINRAEATEDQLHLHEQEDAAITITPLPYDIDPQVFERIKL